MTAITPFLFAGLLLGLSGGLTPGPLLALVARETLQHGVRAGIGIALAPLLTDPPIILAALLVLQPLADQNLPLALIHLGGGLYLGWLAVESLRLQGAEQEWTPSTGSLQRGVIANFLNPSPYLFWLTVGAPTVLAAGRAGSLSVAAFILAFYMLLVGSKVLLAMALGRARSVLRSRGYSVLMRGLGLLLLAYALGFLRESFRLLTAWASP